MPSLYVLSNSTCIGKVCVSAWIVFTALSHRVVAQGDSAKLHTNGVGNIVAGQKDGEWLFYYPSGKIMAKEFYKSGILNGISYAYFPDGQLASVENWQEDLQEDSAFYYHPNGKLFRKGVYEQGVYQGIWKTYFETGSVEQSCFYQDGLPDGECRNWYPSGHLQEVGFYRAGKKDGQFTWYTDGKNTPSQVAFYRNDSPSGLWIFFSEKGKISRLEQY